MGMATNGAQIPNAKCPLCGEEEWTAQEPVCLPQMGITELGFGLNVRPIVCDVCSNVVLMTLANEDH
jgi:hypothetical protein